MKPTKFGASLAGMALCCAATQVAASPFAHVTDGVFTSSNEWTGANVSKTFFPVVGPSGPAQSGGAYLYVEQGFGQNINRTGNVSPASVAIGSPGTLFLMYDWINSINFPVDANSFLDVFFQVKGAKPADYLVRMFTGSNNFQAYDRTAGSPAPVNPDGSFNVGAGSGWNLLDAADPDLALANFRTAIGSGASPDDATTHLMAEFELSIDRGQGQPGLYDPAPAFWSASAKIGNDPPISSGIFSLNPNGSTNVNPVSGPNGGPISQPIQPLSTVPEPSTLMLVGLGLMACLRANKGRKTSGERLRSA